MRRMIVVLLTLGLLAGALAMPAEAGKKKKKKPKEPVKVERTAEAPYQCPCGIDGVVGFITGGGEFGGATLPTGAAEVFVKVEVADNGGQKVAGSVAQDLDGDGFTDTSADFCGSTETAVPIETGLEIAVYIYTLGTAGCPGPATGGTITATFSNLP